MRRVDHFVGGHYEIQALDRNQVLISFRLGQVMHVSKMSVQSSRQDTESTFGAKHQTEFRKMAEQRLRKSIHTPRQSQAPAAMISVIHPASWMLKYVRYLAHPLYLGGNSPSHHGSLDRLKNTAASISARCPWSDPAIMLCTLGDCKSVQIPACSWESGYGF